MNKAMYLILIGLSVFSCGKDEPHSVLKFYDSYYPLESGVYVDYYVQEINHDDLSATPHDTSFYFLRTLIEDTLVDNQGRITYKYIRMIRSNINEDWQISDVWTTLNNNHKIELIEENRRMVKLILPPTNYAVWDANVYNAMDEMNCNYEAIHDPFQINSIEFDSSVTVQQENILNLVEYKRKYEVYANHVGLVKKQFKDLIISNFDTLNITSGHELTLNCIGFGIQ
tara:strand:- start:592 stop:1272 length:681 start_codon:yes stop_codon:yes gene_type:complete